MIPYLLSLEYKKFKKNPIIIFLICGFMITLPLAAMVGEKVSVAVSSLPVKGKSMFAFPELWNWMGYFGSWLCFFFLGVITIYLITTEVQYKTERQNIINGLERKDYFQAKLLSVFTIAIVATLYYILCTVITGFLTVEDFSKVTTGSLWAISRFFFMSCGFMIFALFIGFVIRRSGLAVFFYLSYVMILEPMIRWGVHEKIIHNNSINWYPMNAAEDLMPLPYYEYSEMLPDSAVNFDFLLSHETALVIVCIYSFLFIAFSFYRFNSKDM